MMTIETAVTAGELDHLLSLVYEPRRPVIASVYKFLTFSEVWKKERV